MRLFKAALSITMAVALLNNPATVAASSTEYSGFISNWRLMEHSAQTSTQSLPNQSSTQAVTLPMLANVFSRGQPFSAIHLSGTVIWYRGTDSETGTFDALVKATGAEEITITLPSRSWTEMLNDDGKRRDCRVKDSISGDVSLSPHSCFNPLPWILPSAFLGQAATDQRIIQERLTPSQLAAVGVSGAFCGFHLYYVPPDMQQSDAIKKSLKELTKSSIVFDSNLNPIEYAYSKRFGKNAALSESVAVSYSSYFSQSGLSLPQHVKVSSGHHLQADITVQSVQVN